MTHEHAASTTTGVAGRIATHDDRVFVVATFVIAAHSAVAGIACLAAGAAGSGLAWLAAVPAAPVVWSISARSARWFRAAIAGAIGIAEAGAGIAGYAVPAALTGPSLVHATGCLALLAGIALIALAFHLALGGRRRGVQALLGIPAVAVLVQWGAVPAIGAGLATHADRAAVPAARTLGLAGWYVPGKNGAAVILAHGSHATRSATAAHLRMLARAGFGVLAFDARGHGESAGAANALGWQGTSDLAEAFAFLRGQAGVDAHRIAALGLSMGGEEALRAAADGVPLAAIVAEGAGASTLGDQRLVTSGITAPIATSVAWLSFREVELLSGDDEPAPLAAIVSRIRQPVLLIASGAAGERSINREFRLRIGPSAQLWYLARTGHTRGLATSPDRYSRRVLGALRTALGLAGPPGLSTNAT